MPYAGADFPNATVGETISYFFDFTNTLAAGETISSASWISAVAVDSAVGDTNAANIVDGSASITGNMVGSQFTGMLAGVKYLVTCTVITNEANHIITFSHFFVDTPE